MLPFLRMLILLSLRLIRLFMGTLGRNRKRLSENFQSQKSFG